MLIIKTLNKSYNKCLFGYVCITGIILIKQAQAQQAQAQQAQAQQAKAQQVQARQPQALNK